MGALTIPQVWRVLGYSRQTVYNLINSGQLNACKPQNGHYRIWPEHLEQFKGETECQKDRDLSNVEGGETGITASQKAAKHAISLRVLQMSKKRTSS